MSFLIRRPFSGAVYASQRPWMARGVAVLHFAKWLQSSINEGAS